jgi:hypothetical protein
MRIADYQTLPEDDELAWRWLDNRRASRDGTTEIDLDLDGEVLELMLTEVDPERGWRVAMALLRAAETDQDVATIAIGPLETLLREHGARFLRRSEELAADDPTFRKALGGVYPHGPIVDLVDRLHLHRPLSG